MANHPTKLTNSVRAGSHGDPLYGGTITPVYPSSAYDYEHSEAGSLYPRYYNTPNQKAVIEKLVALENAEDGILFSSGMAAIFTSIQSFMTHGDHAVFQRDLYGGTFNAIVKEFTRLGMSYSFADTTSPESFEKAITPKTKVIYIETPSNPTLKITDIRAIAGIGKRHGVITIIDNTFASPVNQNPLDLGIDLVTHSGTKYIGGHNDLCCGVALASADRIARIRERAVNYGGAPDAFMSWLVERSLKTLVLRVRQQNSNAMAIAEFLKTENRIGNVYYPGLPDHPGHILAKEQMKGGFGGMLSFEVRGDAHAFMDRLKLITRAISLGGVDSTITSPARTSHSKMSEAERASMGVTDALVRMSVGIEDADDLIADIRQAL
jgi:cystathionine beta-lyase/cystathionine gamma-synthase